MIIGLLISLFFGGGSLEVFYIDNIEKGVKKYVADNDRKKELEGYFKEYKKIYKVYNKGMQSDLKHFKKQNLDSTVPIVWYEDFFKKRLEQTIEIQSHFIDYRIQMQNVINNDEWGQIIELASSAEGKEQGKEAKEARKKSNKGLIHLRQVANENISNPTSRKDVIAAWDIFKEDYNAVAKAYESINVGESEILIDKNVSEAEMKGSMVKINSIRAKMYVAQIGFLIVLKENTSNEEYHALMKEFNKLLK